MSALIWIVGPVNVLRIREDEEAGLGAGRWDIAIGVGVGTGAKSGAD